MDQCIILDDGSVFSKQIHDIFSSFGFVVKAHTIDILTDINAIDENMLRDIEVVVLVKGEHFTQRGNEKFYSALSRYVYNGGKLLAMPWVSWENYYNRDFTDVLPFQHISCRYEENVIVKCVSTLSDRKEFTVKTSCEILKPKDDCTVLLKSTEGMAMFGFRKFGYGLSIYLNFCQHTCQGRIDSPFTYSPLAHNFVRTELHRLLRGVDVQEQNRLDETPNEASNRWKKFLGLK